MELLGRRRHGRAREEEWAEGGATREGGLWADARGRRKKIPEREGEGRMKKIGGEHITAGSYYNPAVMLTYHRRFVIRPGGDALDEGKNAKFSSSFSETMNKYCKMGGVKPWMHRRHKLSRVGRLTEVL